MNVDFGGDKLFGRRFSGVPADTTGALFEFITRVQTLNDKKDFVVALLNKLQKPITEELARPAGQLPISQVVIVDKNSPGGAASSALLATPIAPRRQERRPRRPHLHQPARIGQRQPPHLKDVKIPPDGAAIPIKADQLREALSQRDARSDRAAHVVDELSRRRHPGPEGHRPGRCRH